MVENVTNSNEKFDKALSPNDVINNFKNNKISLPMGMENGSALGNNFENLDYFLRGIRYITLTHSKIIEYVIPHTINQRDEEDLLISVKPL